MEQIKELDANGFPWSERLIRLASHQKLQGAEQVQQGLHLLLLLAFTVLVFTAPAAGQVFKTPESSTTLFAQCFDQFGRVFPNCDMVLFPGYIPLSGSHNHDNALHPFSTLTPNSGNTGSAGVLPTTLRTTIVGEQQVAFACVATNLNICSRFDYINGFNDLFRLLAGDHIELIGSLDIHPDNHNATLTLISGIQSTVSSFISAHSDQGSIGLNDMALPVGGKFDLDQNWASPHAEHDRGTAVDVRGNGGDFSIPQQFLDDFVTLCRQNGATSMFTGVHSRGGTNQHVHCQWPTP